MEAAGAAQNWVDDLSKEVDREVQPRIPPFNMNLSKALLSRTSTISSRLHSKGNDMQALLTVEQ